MLARNFAVEIDGVQFELRSDTQYSAEVYVDGRPLPDTFTLNYQPHARKLHPGGHPTDPQKEKYLRTVARYVSDHPEVLV